MNTSELRYGIRFLFAIIYLIISYNPSAAQFLNIEIDVEPEVDATVEQSLNFGQITSNSGIVEYGLGSASMGKFSIRAVRTQMLLVSVNVPDALRHVSLDAIIPLDLGLAVNSRGTDDWRQADIIDIYPAEIEIRPPDDQPSSEWSIAYLYVFGSINVGNIPVGVYTGDVIMNVEYY